MASAADAKGRPEAELITEQLKELEKAWAWLQDEMAKRRERLNGSNMAQQYYNDADEAEAWIGEQELYMIADEKAKVCVCVWGGCYGSSEERKVEDVSLLFILLSFHLLRMSRAPC